ncbi:hypothetical protein [Desulfovibrio sp. TomC]|uniref:hypothetical protein n=1 Tax=Desulfovibrio sp. TomC TaxID=1562888 RepID=UPI00057451AF|nr:hypothetical protein [Desulfovibrio sp. TomC]KHK01841.1 hypothetical protein NY78_2660 [Desulfovibrio sp. TomC]
MDDIERASQEIFRVFMAEHWVRFYFAMENEGVVFLDVPAEVIEALKGADAVLGEFVAGVNGQSIDMESSRRSVAEFVFRTMEGGSYPPGLVARAFDGKPLALMLKLFSVWLSGHEEMLDAEALPLLEWERLFTVWRQDPAVARFAANLATAGNPATPASGAIH